MTSPSTPVIRTRCEVWTRVMGYHRPVSHFNIGKKSEHYSRKHFSECALANSAFSKKYTRGTTLVAIPAGADETTTPLLTPTTA